MRARSTTTDDPRPHEVAEPGALRRRLGGALLALGAAQFFLAHLVVQSAWTRPPYSWWDTYISDLGAVGCGPLLGNDVCSPWHAGMNTAFVVQGVLLLGGAVVSATAWPPGTTTRVWTAMVGLVGVSWVVVGLVPEDVSLTGHSVGALPIFFLGDVALVMAGVARFTRTRPFVRACALGLGLVGLAGLVAMAVASPSGLIGIGAAERLIVFPLQLWTVIAGLDLAFRRR